MKIIKHCSQKFPTVATGSLVGLDVNGTLEVTNTFPFPVPDPQQDFDAPQQNGPALAPRLKTNQSYQAEMIRMLREVNVDANNVGWYTSANMGNFINSNFIETQYMYQKELNERTVALVHDVSRSSQGCLSLRAYRLSPQFMNAFKEQKFTTETYVQWQIFTHLTDKEFVVSKNPASVIRISLLSSHYNYITLILLPVSCTNCLFRRLQIHFRRSQRPYPIFFRSLKQEPLLSPQILITWLFLLTLF